MESELVKPRVLLVDDESSSQDLAAYILRSIGADVTAVSNGAVGLQRALTERFDLIILDYEMPGMDGLEVLLKLKANERTAHVPVIVVTASDGAASLSKFYDAGAADYVRKPFFGAELRARVRATLENHRLLLQLEQMASHDRLTGLPNRALLLDRIQQSMNRFARHPERPFALLFLDFDRFKLINDSLGHDVGDQLLKTIGDRLRRALRTSDTVGREPSGGIAGRLGGDEFVVLLQDLAKPSDASLVADRLLKVLCERYDLSRYEVVSTVSIGLVLSDPRYENPEDMLRDADAALYEAKAAGRGRLVIFDAKMRDKVQDRRMLETDLQHAVERSQLRLHYQPIVSLTSGRAESFEALMRWEHPERGVVSPSIFIPMAEQSGLIADLGNWAIDEACRQLAQWRREGHETGPTISVNVSARQFSQGGLAEYVQQTLRRHDVAPQSLNLEVTESQVMQNVGDAVGLLRRLRTLGVHIHIDDFGTGYSSLSCLQQFAVDAIKIDRSFVANIPRGRDFAALIAAITQMSKHLRLRTVAEGIETIEQLTLLQSLECDLGQGYFFSKPLPPADVPSFHAHKTAA